MDAEGHENDPLHGVTLQMMLERLVEKYGWDGLAERIPIRCFSSDPSLSSSLTFLRRTPWARTKVEALYLGRLGPRRGPARKGATAGQRPAAPEKDAGRRPGGRRDGNRFPGLFSDEP